MGHQTVSASDYVWTNDRDFFIDVELALATVGGRLNGRIVWYNCSGGNIRTSGNSDWRSRIHRGRGYGDVEFVWARFYLSQ